MAAPHYIADINGYIFFSQNTTGNVGRPVKIHASVFLEFYCEVDPRSGDGQMVIRDIENLRTHPNAMKTNFALPAPRNAPSSKKHVEDLAKARNLAAALTHKIKTESEGVLTTKNVQAFYHIHQKDGDKSPTVYISEVKVKRGDSDDLPGLYLEGSTSRGQRVITRSKDRKINGKTTYISGASPEVAKAMDQAKIVTGEEHPALFFTPPSVAEDLGVFKSNRLSEPTQKAIYELEQTLKENQKSKVSWYVEGEGAAVLSHAIKQISGTLENHSFKFINSRADTPALLQMLNQKKAQLSGEIIQYHSDHKALLALAGHKEELNKQIGILPGNIGYDAITRRYLMQQIDALGSSSSAQAPLKQQTELRGSKQTFVDALLKAVGSRPPRK